MGFLLLLTKQNWHNMKKLWFTIVWSGICLRCLRNIAIYDFCIILYLVNCGHSSAFWIEFRQLSKSVTKFTAVRVPFHTSFKIRVMLIIEGLTMTEKFGTSVKEELFETLYPLSWPSPHREGFPYPPHVDALGSPVSWAIENITSTQQT